MPKSSRFLFLAFGLLAAACSTTRPNQAQDPEGRAVNAAVLSDSGQRSGGAAKPTPNDRVVKTASDPDCIPNPDGTDSCAPTSAPIVIKSKKKQ